jgi:hypothetical protein
MSVKLGLVLRVKHKMRMSDDAMPGRMFGPTRGEVTRGEETSIMRSFISCALYQMLLGTAVKEDASLGSMRTKFCFENP